MTEISGFITTGIGLSLISMLIILIIDWKKDKKFIISFVVSSIIAPLVANFIWEPLGGLVPALFLAYIAYLREKNAVYATFLSFVAYTTYILADLILGLIYMDLFRIKLLQHLAGIPYLIVYLSIVCIFSIILALIIKIIIEHKIKIKEVVLYKKARISVYIVTAIAFVVQMIFVQINKSTGVQSEFIKNTLFAAIIIIIFVMYIFYYLIQKCTVKSENAITMISIIEGYDEQQTEELLSHITDDKLKNMIKNIRKKE